MRRLFTATCLLALAGCFRDAAGPQSLVLVNLTSEASDSIAVGEPGRPLSSALRYRVVDLDGVPQAGARVTWQVAGANARVDSASTTTDVAGELHGRWVLGTVATDPQSMTVRVETRGGRRVELSRQAVVVPTYVAQLGFDIDTVSRRVGTVSLLSAVAVDSFGNRFVPGDLQLRSLDTASGLIEESGRVRVLRRGWLGVVARSGARMDTVWINGIQVVARIETDADTLTFHSLAQSLPLQVRLIDDLGQPVADSTPSIVVPDTSVVAISSVAPFELRSRANGVTQIRLVAGAVERQLVGRVIQEAVAVSLETSDLAFDALGDSARLSYAVRDSVGSLVTDAAVSFTTSDPGVVTVDRSGLAVAVGNGSAELIALAPSGAADTTTVTVEQRATNLTATDTMTFSALGAEGVMAVQAFDRLGSNVVGNTVTYSSLDTAVAAVSVSGRLVARGNGVTTVSLRSGSASTTSVVVVAQHPHHLIVSDTLRFGSLGDSLVVAAVAVDSLGSAVPGNVQDLGVVDAAVAEPAGEGTVRSLRNGTTAVTFTVAGLSGSVTAVVQQVAVQLTVTPAWSTPILSIGLDSLMPVTCTMRDARGVPMTASPLVLPSAAGHWTGSTCDGLRLRTSGIDTIRVRQDTVAVDLPVVLAVRAIVDEPLGHWLDVDSMPTGTLPWAPSVRRNSRGEMEVYFAGYPTNPIKIEDHRADLHRLVSSDGIHFRYDGVVLQHDPDVCALDGSGIENVSIVPRSDAPGWRMFFAAGSFPCYGWQVFSAVSTDERTWVKESGIRIDNGGLPPPAGPNYAPWPAGEGMVTEQLPSGEWQMTIGSYERVLPYEDKFQITQWRSVDQLTWRYMGVVVSTHDMPAEASSTVYSPTIREIAPGVYRLIFAGDDRGHPGWRGRLWSAISTDKTSWQLEGMLMGGETTKLWYSALLDDQLVFVREDDGAVRRLAVATVRMP